MSGVHNCIDLPQTVGRRIKGPSNNGRATAGAENGAELLPSEGGRGRGLALGLKPTN